MSTFFKKITLLLCISCLICLNIQGFDIVDRQGKTATIVTPENPAQSIKLAAWELQNYVNKITGKILPIKTSTNVVEGNVIFIGTPGFSNAYHKRYIFTKPLEYMVQINKNSIVLLGKDASHDPVKTYAVDYGLVSGEEGANKHLRLPGVYDARGSLRATYYLLDLLGVRFYGPKEISVIYPTKKTLSVKDQTIIRSPDMIHSSGSLTWGWPLMRGLYGNPSSKECELFSLRIGVGGIPWYTNHTIHSYQQRFPRDQYPEIYPPVGKESSQLCYSSDQLAELVAKDAADYFAGKQVPHLNLPMGSDFFPVVPNDAGNYCTCDKCNAVLKADAKRSAFFNGRAMFNNGQASNYWFAFINKVARLVKKTNPDKYVSTLAYEQYFWLPEFELESNISVAPCLHAPRLYMLDKTTQNEMKWYNEWVELSKAKKIGPIFLWNYLCFPEEPAVMRKWNCFPGFSANKAGEMTKKFAKDGVHGLFFCGIGEQLDFYVIMKLMDDSSLVTADIINEFFVNYFGDASKPMKAFYRLIENTFFNPEVYGGIESHQTEKFAWTVLGTPEVMAKLKTYITEAEQLANTPHDKKRVALWETVYDHMVKGREKFQVNHRKVTETPPHTSIAEDYITEVNVTTCWQEVNPYLLVTGQHMIESTLGVLGTRTAKLDIRNDANRHWSAYAVDGVWVEFDLGALYDLDEILIWNYQQNRGYGLTRIGMKNVEITASPTLDISNSRIIFKGIIPQGDDKAAFTASKAIKLDEKTPVRYIRITSKGPVGVANWGTDPKNNHHDWAGLGAVRFYGKKSTPPR